MKKVFLGKILLAGAVLVGCSANGKEIKEIKEKYNGETLGWSFLEQNNKLANLEDFKPKHNPLSIQTPKVNLAEVLQGNAEQIGKDFVESGMKKNKHVNNHYLYKGKDVHFDVWGETNGKGRTVEIIFDKLQTVHVVKNTLENMGLPVPKSLGDDVTTSPVHFELGDTVVEWRMEKTDSKGWGLIKSIIVEVDNPKYSVLTTELNLEDSLSRSIDMVIQDFSRVDLKRKGDKLDFEGEDVVFKLQGTVNSTEAKMVFKKPTNFSEAKKALDNLGFLSPASLTGDTVLLNDVEITWKLHFASEGVVDEITFSAKKLHGNFSNY